MRPATVAGATARSVFAQACTDFHKQTFRKHLQSQNAKSILAARLSREALKTLRLN